MMMGLHRPYLFGLIFLIPSVFINGENVLPNGDCSIQNGICEAHDNLISITNGVASIDDCRNICYEDANCSHLSYYPSDGVPFRRSCFTFSACPSLDLCYNCSTEERLCNSVCGKNINGQIGENMVGFITDIETERECHHECWIESSCNFYTYFNESSAYMPNLCILLSEILAPLENCENCQTGPKMCMANTCSFKIDIDDKESEIVDHFLFTSNGSFTVDRDMFSNCELHAL